MKGIMGKVSKLLLVGVLLFPIGVAGDPSQAVAAPVEKITISGIIAKDIYHEDDNNLEPKTQSEIAALDPQVDGRTGYSFATFICDTKNEYNAMGNAREAGSGNHWRETLRFNTEDSHGKMFDVSLYKQEIIYKYDQKTYDLALKSGKQLSFQEGSKRVIYSKDTRNENLPCTDGMEAYFYNNLEFYVTLEFEDVPEEEEIPPPVQGRACVPSKTVVSTSTGTLSKTQTWRIIECTTLSGSTPGKTDGEVKWRLYKPNTTANSAAKVENQLKKGVVKHFEERPGSELWTTTAPGVTPAVKTGPSIYENVNADGIKGVSVKYRHEYKYTNDYKETFSQVDTSTRTSWEECSREDKDGDCIRWRTVYSSWSSWSPGSKNSQSKEADWSKEVHHKHDESLNADHKRGEQENLGESVTNVKYVVGRSKVVRGTAAVQEERFQMNARARETRDTQGSIQFAEHPFQYSVDFAGEAWHHIDKQGHYYATDLDKNIRSKYVNNTGFSSKPYAIPVKVGNVQGGGGSYTVPIVSTDDFYTTRATGFVFSVTGGSGSPESVAASEYKSFTGANYRDSVVNAPEQYKTSYYMPIDANGGMKINTSYTHEVKIGKMGLSDMTFQFDKTFSFNNYLIGSVFDKDVWIVQQHDPVVDVSYPYKVKITQEQGQKIKEASKNRTMLLHGMRVTDGLDFYDKISGIVNLGN